jgi:hypothetical protein
MDRAKIRELEERELDAIFATFALAKLEREIDTLARTGEAIVVATGAPRDPECPPWVVLGVRVAEGVSRAA